MKLNPHFNYRTQLEQENDSLKTSLKWFNENYYQVLQDSMTLQSENMRLRDDLKSGADAYYKLRAENIQLGIDSQVEVHKLRKQLAIAMKVAEIWKSIAESNRELVMLTMDGGEE